MHAGAPPIMSPYMLAWSCVQVEAVYDVAWGGVSMLNALLASAEVC